jgi:alanine-synthesizing transaminase
MQHAIVAALRGDRAHQVAFRAALRERAQLTSSRLNAIPGMSCVPPVAAFYAMPKVELPPGRTDEDYVLGLLRATGVLVVYGSGFGLPADQGFMRVVFLADTKQLAQVYDAMAEFTREFLRGSGH